MKFVLVPESREELTTEGGLDVAGDERRLKGVIRKLHSAKIEVSAFIDPEPGQIEAAHRAGAESVELHTGVYANATTPRQRHKELSRHARAAVMAHEFGLRVNAGHGLHYANVREYIEDVPASSYAQYRTRDYFTGRFCRPRSSHRGDDLTFAPARICESC